MMERIEPDNLFDRLTIEPMRESDLNQVGAIERASFPRPWTIEGLRTELNRQPAVCLVLRDGQIVLGYLIFWVVLPEVHILNIAVKPDYRRLGLGWLLLEYLLEYSREVGGREVFLEVRRSNQAAMALYRKAGFIFCGVRKNYYAEEKEDALVMTRTVVFSGP